MKLGMFQTDNRSARPGMLVDDGMVDISDVAPTMSAIIAAWDDLRDRLQRLSRERSPLPLEQVRLRAPLPRPSKSCAASPTTGSMPSVTRNRSTCF